MRILKKYIKPGPRYTSYPSVPHWSGIIPTPARWFNQVNQALNKDQQEGISLYIHLPFCESLCTYCGCTTRITKNHRWEQSYIEALLNEWQMYVEQFNREPLIRAIHLGGGTPTFFKPENLSFLIRKITDKARLHPDIQFSFEAHPASTSNEHLQELYNVGFRRLSLGIQDFNKDVQKLINRKQSVEEVAGVMHKARAIGYTSVNFDLIYGLPGQTQHSLLETLLQTAVLDPDRIAYYSYAHVPHMKPAQRSYEQFLPDSDRKFSMYVTGRNQLLAAGYIDIGMDHFARTNDSLVTASKSGKLHRNFMGYTEHRSNLLIGLGMSAISDTGSGFAQNSKKVEGYLQQVNNGKMAHIRGHELNWEEKIIREHLLNIMCRNKTNLTRESMKNWITESMIASLLDLQSDGLIRLLADSIEVTRAGRPYLRNICMALDKHLYNTDQSQVVFSKTI